MGSHNHPGQSRSKCALQSSRSSRTENSPKCSSGDPSPDCPNQKLWRQNHPPGDSDGLSRLRRDRKSVV